MNEFELSISHRRDIPQNSEVGEFKSSTTNLRCFIILNDEEVHRHQMREMMVTSHEDDQGRIYYIILTSAMLKKIQTEKKHLLFPIFHELGHIIHKHFESNITSEQAHQERKHATLDETVSVRELEADRFAVQLCGKSAAINALDIIYNERAKTGDPNSELNHLGLLELILRKKAIQKLTLS